MKGGQGLVRCSVDKVIRISAPYWRPLPIAPGVTLTFYDAGHILGSAIVVLDIQERGKKPVRLVFSGDLGRQGLAILRDPEFI